MAFSASEKHIIVNYHYIRDWSENYSAINSCPIREFERQIYFLSKNFKIVSVSDVFAAAEAKDSSRFCALTFDDCLKDVNTNAVPILRKYNVTATLFPITSVFDGHLPVVHKVHILLSKIPINDLVGKFNRYLEKNFSNLYLKYQIPTDRRVNPNVRPDDNILTANIKETLAIVPRKVKEGFSDDHFKELGFDERKIVEEFFMNKAEIMNLVSVLSVGSHSHNHGNLATMTPDEIKDDLAKSQQLLSSLSDGKKDVDVFSYPHGRWNSDVINILKSNGFKYGLTIEERGVAKGEHPLLLPRYDTNCVRDYLDSF